MTKSMPGPRFPLTLRGYRRQAVDELISRIQRTLHGHAGDDRIHAADMPTAQLPRGMRGYRESSVDEYLGQAAQQLRGITLSARGGPPTITALLTDPVLRQPFGKPRQQRFPTVGKTKVFDTLWVDMFVEDVHNWVGNALTSRKVRDTRFSEFRDRVGYQPEAVRAWMKELEAYLLTKGH